MACTSTGFPSFLPGVNSQSDTAATAVSSNPSPNGLTTRTSRGLPSSPIVTETITGPWSLAMRASSEYSGSLRAVTTGALRPSG